MYYNWNEVPTNQVINLESRIDEAIEYGYERINDAIRNNIPNTLGYRRDPVRESLSILTEMAVAEWAGIDDSQMVYYEPRVNGRLQAAKNPDLLDIEVRRTNSLRGSLLVKPKDVERNVKIIQTVARTSNGYPTGQVYLVGWNYASQDRAAWAPSPLPGCRDYPIEVRRKIADIGALTRPVGDAA